jgi:transposase
MTRMLHPPQSNQAETGGEEVVLGVDTHKDTHVAAALTTMGVLLAIRCFPTTAAGYQQLLGWAQALGGCGEPGWVALTGNSTGTGRGWQQRSGVVAGGRSPTRSARWRGRNLVANSGSPGLKTTTATLRQGR